MRTQRPYRVPRAEHHFRVAHTRGLDCDGLRRAAGFGLAFQFALMGDTGYTSVGIEQFKRLLAAINQTELAFVVHVVDFQTDPRGWNPNPTIGPEPCTDERYKDVYEFIPERQAQSF